MQIEKTTWKQSADTLARLRATVFIAEQRVPEELELDEYDASAIHWLARNENRQAVGVARLVGNQIGRMAVLREYRGLGVGTALLQAIIRFASTAGIGRLELHAQCHAIDFYRHNGFDVTGGEFDDAGIPHVPMALKLGT